MYKMFYSFNFYTVSFFRIFLLFRVFQLLFFICAVFMLGCVMGFFCLCISVFGSGVCVPVCVWCMVCSVCAFNCLHVYVFCACCVLVMCLPVVVCGMSVSPRAVCWAVNLCACVRIVRSNSPIASGKPTRCSPMRWWGPRTTSCAWLRWEGMS